MGDDWYRSPAWDERTREDFESRLGRARAHNRPQYLRIKALALLGSRAASLRAEGRRLLHRLIAEYPGSLDAPFAHELLGDSCRGERDYAGAEEHYRACMATAPATRSGTSGLYDLSLAELILESTQEAKYPEALALLEGARPELRFDADVFRYNAALALVAYRMGDRPTCRRAARAALDVAGRGPQLPRHPTVGRVRMGWRTARTLRRLSRV